MPAGKRRRPLGAAARDGFFDPALAARLWAAAESGARGLDRLLGRRAEWLGKAEALPPMARAVSTRKLFSWPPFAKPRDEIADRQAEIRADLEAVARDRSAASPELAQARTEASGAASHPLKVRAGRAA